MQHMPGHCQRCSGQHVWTFILVCLSFFKSCNKFDNLITQVGPVCINGLKPDQIVKFVQCVRRQSTRKKWFPFMVGEVRTSKILEIKYHQDLQGSALNLNLEILFQVNFRLFNATNVLILIIIRFCIWWWRFPHVFRYWSIPIWILHLYFQLWWTATKYATPRHSSIHWWAVLV